MNSVEDQLEGMLKELKSRSKLQVVLETGFYAFISAFTLVGNVVTLLVVASNRRMRTVPNMLVVSLAVSDFLLGALSTSNIGVITFATSQWPFSDMTCQYQGYICVTLGVASMQTLALMAVNRYFRIVRPAKYRRYFTKKRTIIMILLSWFFSMWATLPYFFSGHKMVFHPSKCFCYLQIDSGLFTAFLVTVYVGFPICLIFFCYFKIYRHVRSHNMNFQGSRVGNNTINVEEIKVARTLFVIVLFFNLCWTPVLLIDIVDTILGRWSFPREAYIAYSFLATISSALNPMIYGVLNRNFQKEYLKFLRCSCCRLQVAVEPFTVHNGGSTICTAHNDSSGKPIICQ
ncbi:melatonin-related receptor-like [Oculina patagonica]